MPTEPLTPDDLRIMADRRLNPRREVDQRLHLARELTLQRARIVVREYVEQSPSSAEPALRSELDDLATMIAMLDEAEAAAAAR